MSESELRIGNMVYNDKLDHIEIVNFIAGGVINIHPCEHYSGVLLNEEWLLKLGVNSSKTYLNGYELNNFLIMKSSDLFCFYYNNHDSKLEIKYVHQLQNLYFALTGEELTEKV